MKPVREMSFREQLGAAAKNGSYSNSLRAHGFRALTPAGELVTLTAEELESRVSQIAERDVGPDIWPLVEAQPMERRFEGWSDLELLKLRAYIHLRLGRARALSGAEKTLALTRTYALPRGIRQTEAQSPYLDGTPGRRLSRRDRALLLETIAQHIEARLKVVHSRDAIDVVEDESTGRDFKVPREDFLIEHAYDLYTYPATTKDKLQISRYVTVRALRDNLTEYRFTAESVSRGRGAPEIELLSGPSAHFEKLRTRSRGGVPGYEYQVVIPFKTPMMKSDEPRHFSWIIRSRVSPKFFLKDETTRTVGFRPSREVRTARVAVQFPSGSAPQRVGVVTNARVEEMDVYDPTGETLPVIDNYVEKTWQSPHIAHYCNLVWPR